MAEEEVARAQEEARLSEQFLPDPCMCCSVCFQCSSLCRRRSVRGALYWCVGCLAVAIGDLAVAMGRHASSAIVLAVCFTSVFKERIHVSILSIMCRLVS